MTRMRWLATLPMMAAVIAVVLSGTPSLAQTWRPMPPEEAHLVVPVSAFGSGNIRRYVIDLNTTVRYERWVTPIDPSRRFFQLVLRESTAGVPVREEADLREFVVESWGAEDASRFAWGDEGTIATPLGPSEYAHFSVGDIGCVAFQTFFGGTSLGGGSGNYPANALKGLYCDPFFPRIPDTDIQRTISSIGVTDEVAR